MRLQLGVDDVPYVAPDEGAPTTPKKGKRRKKSSFMDWVKKAIGRHPSYGGVITTGDVAGILEDKYGVMAFFAESHGQDIADDMAKAAGGALDILLLGGPATDPFAGAKTSIEARFRQFLSMREMDGKVPGVPTDAAMKGHSKRFKRATVRRPDRPSFIDTGLYQANMRATFTEGK